MKLRFHADALAALRSLQNDPGQLDLFRRVVSTIREIRTDPSSRTSRRQAWVTDEWGQVWAVPTDDWLVIWTSDIVDPDTVIILYVGPGI